MVRAAGWPGMGSSLPSGACQSNSFSDDDEFSLPLLSRGIHASFDGSSETPPKKYAPGREQASGCSHCVRLYITFSAKIKALSRYSSFLERSAGRNIQQWLRGQPSRVSVAATRIS